MKRVAILAALVIAPAAAGIDGSREITCFSGGREIYHGRSDPAAPVYLETADNHVIFVDRETGRHMRVGGDCVVSWNAAAR